MHVRHAWPHRWRRRACGRCRSIRRPRKAAAAATAAPGDWTTWLDVGLYLIARYTSVEAAMQVARINPIDWHQGGQQPFARLARSREVDDALIARCQTWITEHYDEQAPVAAMVQLSGHEAKRSNGTSI
jgi:transcriptional regulator GlxA family with amidase domain